MSSYFVAFSNDSRDWITLHDGYAEWVSEDNILYSVIYIYTVYIFVFTFIYTGTLLRKFSFTIMTCPNEGNMNKYHSATTDIQ